MHQQFSSINDLFSFGKYHGKSLLHVYNNDQKYIEWCISNIVGFTLSETLISKLKADPNMIIIGNDTKEKNRNLEISIQLHVNVIIENKFKCEILKSAYDDVCSQDPQSKEMSTFALMLSSKIYNTWISKRAVAEKLVHEAAENLDQSKSLLINLFRENFILIENQYEYNNSSLDYHTGELKLVISISIDDSVTPFYYTCNIEEESDLGHFNITC